MKLSADSKNEFFNAEMIGHNRILLNGVEMKYVTFADEDEGFIICHKTDEDGCLVTNGDYLVYEKMEGRVQIIDTRAE